MKKLIIALLINLFSIPAFADSITLNSGETVTPPTFTRLTNWTIDRIDPARSELVVKYRRRDASNNLILDSTSDRNGYKYWYCRNIQQGDNAECIALDDPWDCCTGAGTGTCPEVVDNCFSDVFGFQIRSQDVGTGIGIGLRTLIWNQMKQDILSGGNDGSFD